MVGAHEVLQPLVGSHDLRRAGVGRLQPVDEASARTSLLVLGDSLAFHGPRQAELSTDPGLFPNVAGAALGWPVDTVGRLGWTAREGWFALTKDPYVYSVLLPRARAVLLALGSSDQLPASLPTWLKEGIAYVRPGWVRRPLRRAYHEAHPHVVRATGGRLRVLPQVATDHYLSRCVAGVRTFHPGVPVVGVVPPGWHAEYHGHVSSPHPAAVAAARAWGRREGVPLVDLDALVAPHLRSEAMNPDGMHWGWDLHREAGLEVARVVARACRR